MLDPYIHSRQSSSCLAAMKLSGYQRNMIGEGVTWAIDNADSTRCTAELIRGLIYSIKKHTNYRGLPPLVHCSGVCSLSKWTYEGIIDSDSDSGENCMFAPVLHVELEHAIRKSA